MIISGKFVVGLHPHFGTPGLKMVDRPHFEPLGAMAVAHDLMEHFPDDDGSPEHELLAIGASWFVRDHGNYLEAKGFPRFKSLREHLHANFKNVGDDLNKLDRSVRPCPIEVAEMNIPAGVSDLLAAAMLDPGADCTLLVLARDWLKWGYVRAADRYSPLNAPMVCELFERCEFRAAVFLAEAAVGDECEITITTTPPYVALAKPNEEESQ